MSLENAHRSVRIALDAYCTAAMHEMATRPPLVLLPIEQAARDPNETLLLFRQHPTLPLWEWAGLGSWQPDGGWEVEGDFEGCNPTHFMREPEIPARAVVWMCYQLAQAEPITVGPESSTVKQGEFYAVPMARNTGELLCPQGIGPFASKETVFQILAGRGVHATDIRDNTPNIEPLIK